MNIYVLWINPIQLDIILYDSLHTKASVRISKLRWAEHVQRMDVNEISKRAMQMRPEGKSYVGQMDGWMFFFFI